MFINLYSTFKNKIKDYSAKNPENISLRGEISDSIDILIKDIKSKKDIEDVINMLHNISPCFLSQKEIEELITIKVISKDNKEKEFKLPINWFETCSLTIIEKNQKVLGKIEKFDVLKEFSGEIQLNMVDKLLSNINMNKFSCYLRNDSKPFILIFYGCTFNTCIDEKLNTIHRINYDYVEIQLNGHGKI